MRDALRDQAGRQTPLECLASTKIAARAADAANEMGETPGRGLGQKLVPAEHRDAEQFGAMELGALVENGNAPVGFGCQQGVDNNFSVSASPEDNEIEGGGWGLGRNGHGSHASACDERAGYETGRGIATFACWCKKKPAVSRDAGSRKQTGGWGRDRAPPLRFQAARA